MAFWLQMKTNASLSAGVSFQGSLFGVTRGRILPSLPYSEDFEKWLEDLAIQALTVYHFLIHHCLGLVQECRRWQVQDMEENSGWKCR